MNKVDRLIHRYGQKETYMMIFHNRNMQEDLTDSEYQEYLSLGRDKSWLLKDKE